MVALTPRRYEFSTKSVWTEELRAVVSADGRDAITIGCPPEFGCANSDAWSPEHLFVATVELCLMLTFLDLARRRKIEVRTYESDATGAAQMQDGAFRFSTVKVTVNLEVASDEDLETAARLFDRAEKSCLVAKSLITKVETELRLSSRQSKVPDGDQQAS